MAVKQKCAGGSGIAEIHADLHAVEWPLAFPERNFDGIAHVVIRDGLSIHLQHLEVNLVHVESVRLESAVFDGPILDRPYFGRDDRFLVALEDLLLLSVNRNVKLDWAVGAAKFLREKEFPLSGRGLCGEVSELELDRRRLRRRF